MLIFRVVVSVQPRFTVEDFSTSTECRPNNTSSVRSSINKQQTNNKHIDGVTMNEPRRFREGQPDLARFPSGESDSSFEHNP